MQTPELNALYLMRPTELKLLLESASHKYHHFSLHAATPPPSQTVSDGDILLLRARRLTSGEG